MSETNGFVQVRGARQHNLRDIDLDFPRNALVAFTGVSGSGKSSLAFGTVYAEAQRRYFESVAPYARRLIAQLPAPEVGEIRGLPPAVALEQRRAEPTSRSSVGTLTTISNLLRMLFSRAGTYPPGAASLDSDAFSPNTQAGACLVCNGMGTTHAVSEDSLVPDPQLSIREGAIAAWPGAWQGKNLRDILDTLGYDIDRPWKRLSRKDRDWILFTSEKPVVTVHPEREADRIQRPYKGTYQSASDYVLNTFANTRSATLRKRVQQFIETAICGACNGKRLKSESLAVLFNGFDIEELGGMPLSTLTGVLAGAPELNGHRGTVAAVLVGDIEDRMALLRRLGLDYLSLDRATPTLSTGELARLRLTTQLRSGLFSVVYLLDEPTAGLHPGDIEALVEMLAELKEAGNTVVVLEHDMEVVRRADWVVDLGPGAGAGGGSVLYSGPVDGLAASEQSVTRRYIGNRSYRQSSRPEVPARRQPDRWMHLLPVRRHNLDGLSVDFPLRCLTAISGVSGAGKSSLLGVISEAVAAQIAARNGERRSEADGKLEGAEQLRRLVEVDQKPIGRTPRSNLATYTGLFDYIRKAFAATARAKSLGFKAGRFSFNVAGGRCPDCEGEGFVSVELLFLPTVYSPCSTCSGTRFNADTLSVIYRGLNIAQTLELSVDQARDFFRELPQVERALATLEDVGLGYLKLGQPATELSGGEAQRIKLATELKRKTGGDALYLLDEPTTGLHPADVEKLLALLHKLVGAGNTVILVENDMDVVAAADWVIDLGPGAGDDGGQVVASGTAEQVCQSETSRTAPYLMRRLERGM